MRKRLHVIFLLSISFSCLGYCQTKTQEDDKVYDVVELMPSFPGGTSALMTFWTNNFKYPSELDPWDVQGRVCCSFVVGENGDISNICVTKSLHPALDREVCRVISRMPKWIPGKQNGKSVRVKYTLPFMICLQ